MEVIDLSVRKSAHMPTYAPQNPYMMRDFPMYTYAPPTLRPTTMQPSVSHLGLFQQLHYAALPQIAPPTVNPHVSPQKPVAIHSSNGSVLMHSASSSAPMQSPSTSNISSDKESESIYKVPAPQRPLKRPFKTLASAKTSPLSLVSALDPSFETEYEEYRKQVLSRISEEESTSSNKNMRRNIPSNPEKSKDPEYLEKRRKNNEAAKKSREARKAKEDELAIRVAFLEKENLKMKFQLAAIEREKKMILIRRRQLS